MRSQVLWCAYLLCVLAVRAQQPGDLDPSFGSDGIATLDFAFDANERGQAMARQADGRIVVVGSTNSAAGSAWALVRFLPDGSRDPDFGTNGIVTGQVGTAGNELNAVAIQPDGRIVVAGTVYQSGTEQLWAIARYTSNGQPDATFGDAGLLLVDVGTGYADHAQAIALQADGRIVTTGWARNAADFDIGMVRCTAAGVLDASFSGDGKLTLGYGTNNDGGEAIVVQPDGMIVVAGHTADGQSGQVVVARVSAAGLPDPAFGTNGSALCSFGDSYDQGFALALQPDGRIMVGGGAYSVTNWPLVDMALLRLTANGALDPAFGGDGRYVLPPQGISAVSALALMPDGRIVIGGTANTSFVVAMVQAAGGLDASFGTDGVVTTALGDDAIGTSVAVQPDGKVLLAGYTRLPGTHDDLVVLRYHTDQSIGLGDLGPVAGELLLYPNPAGATATITFALAQDERLRIQLLEAQGRVVGDLATMQLYPAGLHRLELVLPAPLASGTYLITGSSAQGRVFQARMLKGCEW